MRLKNTFYIPNGDTEREDCFLVAPYRFPSIECPSCNDTWGGISRKIFDDFPDYNLCEKCGNTIILSTDDYRNTFGKYEKDPTLPIANFHFHTGGYIDNCALLSFEKLDADVLLPSSSIMFSILISDKIVSAFKKNSVDFKIHPLDFSAVLGKSVKRQYKTNGEWAITRAYKKHNYSKYEMNHKLYELEIPSFLNIGIEEKLLCKDCGVWKNNYTNVNMNLLFENYSGEDMFWFGAGIPAFSEKCISILKEFDEKLDFEPLEKFILWAQESNP